MLSAAPAQIRHPRRRRTGAGLPWPAGAALKFTTESGEALGKPLDPNPGPMRFGPMMSSMPLFGESEAPTLSLGWLTQ